MHCPLTNINAITQDTKCHYVILGGTLQIYPTLLRSILFILIIYDFVSLLLSALLLDVNIMWWTENCLNPSYLILFHLILPHLTLSHLIPISTTHYPIWSYFISWYDVSFIFGCLGPLHFVTHCFLPNWFQSVLSHPILSNSSNPVWFYSILFY